MRSSKVVQTTGTGEGADHEALEALFKDLAAPAIDFELSSVREEKMALGQTRVGGRPDLPSQRSWPLTAAGKPMSFLAQLELRKMKQVMLSSPLPASGLLSFFVRFDDEFPEDGALECAVHFSAPETGLKRTDFPAGLVDDSRFKPCALSGGLVHTYPELDHAEVNSRLQVDEDVLSDFWSDMNMGTHLLGFAHRIQDDPELDAELALRLRRKGRGMSLSLADMEQAKKDWSLLFQLDSEEEAGMMWGDVGYLYFMMRKDDLKHHRFENAVCIFQCS